MLAWQFCFVFADDWIYLLLIVLRVAVIPARSLILATGFLRMGRSRSDTDGK